jgi:hypothetical protein
VRYPISRTNRYYFSNILALLDRPGEAHIDVKRGIVRLWPSHGQIDGQQVVVATAPHIIRIAGDRADRPVLGLHFHDLDLSIAAGDAVEITNASGCDVSRCRIENAGDNGVTIAGSARHISIRENLIQYIGAHGVVVIGSGPAPDPQANDVNHHHTIHGNHIHHVGRRVGHAAGVQISQSGYNRITHNLIHHTPRYGINVTGLRYQLLREQVAGVTWENHWDYLHARNNEIAYNEIHHAVLDSADAGGIAAWGAGRDNHVHHNLIHEIGNSNSYNTHGIFLDDGVDYWRVSHNIVWGLIGKSDHNEAAFIKGIGHVVENNIFIVDHNTRSGIASHYYEKTGEVSRDQVYRRNIVYIETDRGGAYHFWNWSDDRVARCDRNLLWAPHQAVTVYGSPADGSFSRWRTLLGGRFDRHTLIADPQFVDPARRDYRLRPTSPAWRIGFEPIDVGKIGLTEAFPPRLRRR